MSITSDEGEHAFGLRRLLVPSLEEVCRVGGLRHDRVDLDFGRSFTSSASDRAVVPVTDGEATAEWHVASLRDWYRGDAAPPARPEHDDRYVGLMMRLEHTIMRMGLAGATPLDADVSSVLSCLR